jgi:hypothetical protein
MRKLAAVLLLLAAVRPLPGAALSNEQFCLQGVAKLADSLALKLAVPADSGLLLLPIEGRFGQQLLTNLAASLDRSGVPIYLSATGVAGNRPFVKTIVDDYHLSYESVRHGLFSRGRVARVFSIGGNSKILEPDGRLLRTAGVSSMIIGDTLSNDEARAARGKDSFLSPALPPTTYQRLVEPGLILGITGALVYLFFASR